MLKQKMRNIPLSRDEGQCAAVMRGVRKFTKLPTLPYTRGPWVKPVTLFITGRGIFFSSPQKGPEQECPPRDEQSENIYIYAGLPHRRDKDNTSITHPGCKKDWENKYLHRYRTENLSATAAMSSSFYRYCYCIKAECPFLLNPLPVEQEGDNLTMTQWEPVALCTGHVTTVPIRGQQPNRHGKLPASTKGRCQTKPLVVGLLNIQGQVWLDRTPLGTHHLQLSLCHLSDQEELSVFVFLSHRLCYFRQTPTFTLE